MNEQIKSKIIIRHACCWAAAFIVPPVVMVVLDLFDKETPTRVAIFSSMALMLVFAVSNAFLSGGLSSASNGESDAGESSESPA